MHYARSALRRLLLLLFPQLAYKRLSFYSYLAAGGLVQGGDGADEIPTIPEDVASLNDEQLAELRASALAAAKRIRDRDADLIGDRSDQDLVEAMTTLVAGIERVKAEQGEREKAATEAAEKIDALAQALEDEKPADESEEKPAEGDPEDKTVEEKPADEKPAEPTAEEVAATEREAEREQEALAASARRRTFGLPRRSAERAPVDENRVAITASAGDPGLNPGAELDPLGLANAMIRRRQSFGRNIPDSVRDERVSVASIRARYPDERVLHADDEGGNWQRIESVIGGRPGSPQQVQALAASGGLCAPVTPYYDLALLSEAMTPVIDSLPTFNADRGGIRFMTPPQLSAVTTAVGRITAANDKLGGTNATKTCQTITCPAVNEVDVAAIFHCVQYGNMPTRAWPEQIDNFNRLTMAALARVREVAVLDAIKAASVKATLPAVAGSNATLWPGLLLAAAGMRNRQRMDPRTQLRILLPAWIIDELLADVIRGQFARFDSGIAELMALFGRANLTPVFYVDSPSTGPGQQFAAQTDNTVLNGWPSVAQVFLFPEGSFLHLDMGTLELGLVRDSTLNKTNDYQIFGEVFEETAFIGIECVRLEITMCDTGAVAGTVTVACGS